MKHTDAPMTRRWICGCLFALLLALPAAAAPTGDVVKFENTGSKLIAQPVIDGFDRIMLTVTGPCNYIYREVIEPGGVGIFRTSEETIDAIYRLEVVAIPKVDGEILEILHKARQLDDNTAVNALCREGALPGDPLTQSLGFRIFQGTIMWDPDKVEDRGRIADSEPTGGDKGIPLKDFVIIDDLIVDGSACIGFDCVNGESFGFDTIRVKENNLRIKFDDTSVAASFPRNDWQLTANDSANGGASKFSIDDISGGRTPFTVEANARSHSLYVDDGGRIGSRTSTPSTEIHTIDGDTPTLRLQQDGSSGFAPQTWDVAGNETNFFIRDVTNGSTLPFRIRPGAPTSSIFIDVSGDVGLGTASPDEALHIEDTATTGEVKLKISNLASAGNEWAFSVTDEGDVGQQFRMSLQGSGGPEITVNERLDASGDATLEVDGSVEATNVTFTSSRTRKTDIVPADVTQILDRVAQLPVATWRLKTEQPGALHFGPMAEDFQTAFGLGGSGKTISMVDANGVALAAIQGLNKKVTDLEAEKTELQSELAELRALVEALGNQ